MIPYIITFIVSLFFLNLSYKKRGTRNVFFLCCALLPPILLAAFRDSTIGTDTSFYAIPVFEAAVKSADFKDLQDSWKFVETPYLLINFVSAKISSVPVASFFIVQTLILIPVFISSFKLRKHLSPVLFLFIYYCMIYNSTLNMIRQSMAVSIICLATTYFILNKRYTAIILCILATFFHTSAYIGIFCILACVICQKISIAPNKKAIIIMACLILGFIAYHIDTIITGFIERNLVDIKYEAYLSASDGGIFESKINKTELAMDIFIFIFTYQAYKRKTNSSILLFFLSMSLTTCVFDLTGLISVYLSRISKYSGIIACLSIPYISKMIDTKQLKPIPLFSKPILIPLFICYWLYLYIITNSNETYPYTSQILGI